LFGAGQLVVDNVFSPAGAANLLNRIVSTAVRPDRPERARRRMERAG